MPSKLFLYPGDRLGSTSDLPLLPNLLSDVETHTVDTSFIFTKQSNVAKSFFDICNAEMAQSLSSLQKSEF